MVKFCVYYVEILITVVNIFQLFQNFDKRFTALSNRIYYFLKSPLTKFVQHFAPCEMQKLRTGPFKICLPLPKAFLLVFDELQFFTTRILNNIFVGT